MPMTRIEKKFTCTRCSGSKNLRKWYFFGFKPCPDCKGTGFHTVMVDVVRPPPPMPQRPARYSSKPLPIKYPRTRVDDEPKSNNDFLIGIAIGSLMHGHSEPIPEKPPEPEHEGKFGGAGASGSWEESSSSSSESISDSSSSYSSDSSGGNSSGGSSSSSE